MHLRQWLVAGLLVAGVTAGWQVIEVCLSIRRRWRKSKAGNLGNDDLTDGKDGEQATQILKGKNLILTENRVWNKIALIGECSVHIAFF